MHQERREFDVSWVYKRFRSDSIRNLYPGSYPPTTVGSKLMRAGMAFMIYWLTS